MVTTDENLHSGLCMADVPVCHERTHPTEFGCADSFGWGTIVVIRSKAAIGRTAPFHSGFCPTVLHPSSGMKEDAESIC